MSPLRRSSLLLLCALLGILIFGFLNWKHPPAPQPASEAPGSTIIKQPVNFTQRTFDPANPPAEMPPLTGTENAECDSSFLSSATVSGNTRQTDATRATLTVTQVKMTLQLNLTIWVPDGVSQHVHEHEEGHRQISEYYYQTADAVAQRVATRYIGRVVEVTGADPSSESNKVLQQIAAEITAEYNRLLNPDPTQLLYDTITDHSRNGVPASDAVSHAIKNVAVESLQAPNSN